MKRKSIGILLSFVMLLVFSLPHNASAKVMWDGMELKKGQIGKLSVIKQTDLYRINGTKKEFVRKLNPGEVYRIYSFRPGKLGVGAGCYIDRDNSIKYETPSKTKVQALGVKLTEQTYEGQFKYPQTVNLISKSAQDKINQAIKNHIQDSYNAYVSLMEQKEEDRQNYEDEYGYPVPEDEAWAYNYEYNVTYEVKYNENNQLSILIYDYMYTGGAHGMSTVTSYNFEVLTGKQLLLGDIAKGAKALSKIKQYAITDLTNRANRGEMVFPEDLAAMQINNDRPFYFTTNGITIKFYEYEVAPYAAGMPEVKMPYKVFK